jgi:hypothetical protein
MFLFVLQKQLLFSFVYWNSFICWFTLRSIYYNLTLYIKEEKIYIILIINKNKWENAIIILTIKDTQILFSENKLLLILH